jgi:hypothetical protein
MKKLLVLPLFSILLFCNIKKNSVEKVEDTVKSEPVSVTIKKSNCPENGKCTVEIFRNKSLNILKDDLGSTYYKFIDTDKTSVIKYKYDRNPPKDGLKDGNYSEEVIFEINNSDTKMAFLDTDLQKTKMLFGRFCFCRGQTGYYKVNSGNLKLEQKNNEVQYNLDFKITEVPQIITSISETVK